MTNKEIANTFRLLAKLMELHGENKFKIRSYSNAYLTLRKLDRPAAEMSEEELAGIKGVGKAISSKIRELVTTGEMAALEKYRDQTPEGVQDMLQISGFGPSKVRTVWKDLGVETIGELLYAVNENRLIELKGFGSKTQDDLRTKLEYFQGSRGQFRYAQLEAPAIALIKAIQETFPEARVAETGAFRRRCTVLERIELLIAGVSVEDLAGALALTEADPQSNQLSGLFEESIPLTLYTCSFEEWGSKQFRYTAGSEFMDAFVQAFPNEDFKALAEEDQVFAQVDLPLIPAELRENEWGLQLAQRHELPHLLEEQDIKGVIHSHTTYSDGLHTLEEMVTYAREQGFEYIGITDHSKAAFYANGLSPQRVHEQMAAIDQLNAQYEDFRIFKGIESDILADGSLDYEEDLLQEFDFIIASIHSNLRMDEQKATQRLLKAIENPYTSILGHPTGRLLLSRPGYPIDHQRIIDACAANQVAIELNANPYRLDLDWTWIPYAVEKGVLISINPDAHSQQGIHDIHFGTLAARKGGLTAEQCLNSRPANEFYQLTQKGR